MLEEILIINFKTIYIQLRDNYLINKTPSKIYMKASRVKKNFFLSM